MKRLIALIVMLICLVGFVGSSFARVHVRGHIRDGGYVQPHTRSYPDGYLFNNRSYRGW